MPTAKRPVCPLAKKKKIKPLDEFELFELLDVHLQLVNFKSRFDSECLP